jgi:hypothetical protein
MHLRALQMSTAAWLFLAAVLMAGTLGRTIRRPLPADGVTWRAIPSINVVERPATAAHRATVAPTPAPRRSSVPDRVEKRKAAAVLLLLMLGGRDRLAATVR